MTKNLVTELTKEDVEKFSLIISIRAFRTVDQDRPPLIPTKAARRATWVDTAGLYCALDQVTAYYETKDHLTNPVTYLISSENPLSVFDAEAYCKAKGIPEAKFYAGITSGALGIHQLPGLNVQEVIWPSEKNPNGKSLALYIENILNFPQGFTAHKI